MANAAEDEDPATPSEDAVAPPQPAPPAAAEDEAEPAPKETVATTTADAKALGALLSEATLDSPAYDCVLSNGLELGSGARADVLECETEEIQQDEIAYLVIRRTGEDPWFEALATAYEIPGQSCVYTLGTPQFEGTTLRISATETVTTYGNTGDPDADQDESTEVSTTTLTCVLPDDGCEQDVVDG